MKFIFISFAVFLVLISKVKCFYRPTDKFDLYMPNVKPQRSNLYLCTPVKVDPQKSYYIVGFEPNASMHFIHHMIIYGCASPGKSQPVWNCGEMALGDYDEDTANPCSTGNTILYAWARDAPRLDLPNGVAFKVGKDTNIQYLVLQVHYSHVESFKNDTTDSSGVELHYTDVPSPKLAGVFLLGTGGRIRAHSTESMETACPITDDKELHPFRFRTHTHELGVRVAGYRIRKINGYEHWTLIGEHDPLEPQMFYPVAKNMIIQKGDVLAASCKMDATHRNRDTQVGPTGENEMCNFYMMYWVENTDPLDQQFCFSMGPPFYYWREVFENIPDAELRTYRRNDINEE